MHQIKLLDFPLPLQLGDEQSTGCEGGVRVRAGEALKGRDQEQGASKEAAFLFMLKLEFIALIDIYIRTFFNSLEGQSS